MADHQHEAGRRIVARMQPAPRRWIMMDEYDKENVDEEQLRLDALAGDARLMAALYQEAALQRRLEELARRQQEVDEQLLLWRRLDLITRRAREQQHHNHRHRQ